MLKKTILTLGLTSAALLAQTSAVAAQSVTQVFSQQVFYTIPDGFGAQLLSEQSNATQYLHDRLLVGETAQNWSQAITILGRKGGANNPNLTPMSLIGGMVIEFQKACPKSFSGVKLFEGLTQNNTPVAVAVISCGNIDGKSQTALVTTFTGTQDIYAVKWSERGDASRRPLKIDEGKWISRLNQLMPGIQTPIKGKAPAKKSK